MLLQIFLEALGHKVGNLCGPSFLYPCLEHVSLPGCGRCRRPEHHHQCRPCSTSSTGGCRFGASVTARGNIGPFLFALFTAVL